MIRVLALSTATLAKSKPSLQPHREDTQTAAAQSESTGHKRHANMFRAHRRHRVMKFGLGILRILFGLGSVGCIHLALVMTVMCTWQRQEKK